MTMFGDIYTKCDCGFGGDWFCASLSSHEFNRGTNPTARRDKDRNSEAKVYPHISGSYVFARIESTNTKKKFHYKDYESDKATFQAAIDWVNGFFLQKKTEGKQLSLLNI